MLRDGSEQQKSRQADGRNVQLVGEIRRVDNKAVNQKRVPGYFGYERSILPHLDQIKKVPHYKHPDNDNLVKRKFDWAPPHRCALSTPGINS